MWSDVVIREAGRILPVQFRDLERRSSWSLIAPMTTLCAARHSGDVIQSSSLLLSLSQEEFDDSELLQDADSEDDASLALDDALEDCDRDE